MTGRFFRVLCNASIILGLLCVPCSFAGVRIVEFPLSGAVLVGDPDSLAFSQDAKLGLALLVRNDFSAQLFSFSVEHGSVLDSFDLTADFGRKKPPPLPPPFASIRTDRQADTVVVFGNDGDGNQKVLALACDSTGQFSRRWEQTYPFVGLVSDSDVALSPDGSRVFVLYGDGTKPNGINHLALVDATNGAIRGSHDLSTTQGTDRSVIFDEPRGRVIAVSRTTAFIFKPGIDALDLESTIEADSGLVFTSIIGLSHDGRFLLTYAGFSPRGLSSGVLIFLTYDLQTHSVAEFDVPTTLFPFTNDIGFNSDAGLIVAPLKDSYDATSGSIQVVAKPRRDIGIYAVASDGSASVSVQMRTPKGSPAGLFSAVNISKSGALGFVATTRGDLLAFDTLTGETVDTQPIGSNTFTVTQLLEPHGLLSFTNLTNKLFLLDTTAAPAIAGVEVRRSTTTLTGARFLSGAHVQINGVDAGEVNRDPNDPGRIITISRGRKDFPPGQSFSISVINRDGLASEPFVLMR
jgi:hypothetical protein